MGDRPKSSDDGTWTEVERSFFAAAPPEDPEPAAEAPRFDDFLAPRPQRPRREISSWLRTALAGVWCVVDRRRVAFVLVGAIVVAGLTAGGRAFRKGTLTSGETAQVKAPASGPAIAEAAPVATTTSQAAPRPKARSSADVQAPRADVANRRPRAHRRAAPASASAPAASPQRPPATAFMDRETYWAREAWPAPDRSSRPLFSR